ncbi:MAG: flippase [Elusimicrobiota bacterium]
MHTHKSIARNTLATNASSVVNRFIGLITSALLARQLGTEAFGQITLFITFSAIFLKISDFGMLQYITREVAANISDSARWLRQTLILKSLLLGATALIIALALFFVHVSIPTKIIILCSVFFAFGKSYYNVADSFYTAWGKVNYSAFWEFLYAALVLALISVLYFLKILGINSAVLIYTVTILIIAAISLFHLNYKFVRLNSFLPVEFNWSIFTKSYHFFVASLSGIVFLQADILLLRWLHGAEATGYYGAGLALYSGLVLLIANMSRVTFPVFSKYFKESLDEFKKNADRILWYILILLFPLTAGGIVLSGHIITFIYGHQFAPAAISFSFLLIAFLFHFLGSFLVILLQSGHQQESAAKINLVAVCLSAVIGIPLIYMYSYVGASVMRVAINFFICIACFMVVKGKIIKISFSNSLYKPIIATLIMAIILLLLRGMNLIPLLIIGVASYSAVILLLKTFSKNEYSFFVSLFIPKRTFQGSEK